MKVTQLNNIQIETVLSDYSNAYLIQETSGLLVYLKDMNETQPELKWMPLFAENRKLNACIVFADSTTVEKICTDMETQYIANPVATREDLYQYVSAHNKEVFLQDPLYTAKNRIFYKGLSTIKNQINPEPYIIDETKEVWWG